MAGDDEGKQMPLTGIESEEPAVLPAPRTTLAAYRPEAFQGFLMRYANWDKLKRQVHRLRGGEPFGWKDWAVLFYGTALGNLPSVIAEKGSLTWNTNTVVAMIALAIGIICNLAHRSVQDREQGSIDTVLETMDDVEAEFRRR